MQPYFAPAINKLDVQPYLLQLYVSELFNVATSVKIKLPGTGATLRVNYLGATQEDGQLYACASHAPSPRLACNRWSIAPSRWLVYYLIDQTFIEPAMRAIGDTRRLHLGLAVPPRQ